MKQDGLEGPGGSLFQYDWTPDKINWSQECECGEPKTNNANTCQKCAWLDGKIEKHSLVIDTLRNYPDGLTAHELCTELYNKTSHSYTESMYNTLKALMAGKRVARRKVENDIEGQLAGNTTSWVYYLKG